MPPRIPYTKPPFSFPDQLAKLQSRGLAIPDPATAGHFLKFISYYRLGGYGLSFYDKTTNQYNTGKAFQDLIDHYIFDRELRVLIMDEIERVEIAVRTVIVNTLAMTHGAHWYLDNTIFIAAFDFVDFRAIVQREINQSKERFIKHYKRTYSPPPLPASWMVAECLSFGVWVKVYNGLPRPSRLSIANEFGLSDDEMSSFIHSLSVLRNVCAHHGRIFDRKHTHSVNVTGHLNGVVGVGDNTVYARAATLQVMLKRVLLVNHWPIKLAECFSRHPCIHPSALGFPNNWKTIPFWGLTPTPTTNSVPATTSSPTPATFWKITRKRTIPMRTR